MRIKVNDEWMDIKPPYYLKEVLTGLGISQGGIAVAINEQIIPKSTWPEKEVREGDSLLIIQATQGG